VLKIEPRALSFLEPRALSFLEPRALSFLGKCSTNEQDISRKHLEKSINTYQMYCHHNEIPKQVDLNLDLSLSQNKLAS
jgi:hypothetical protein